MKNNVLRTIILSWTILSFLIDLYIFVITPGKVILSYLIILIIFEGLFCWIAYQMFLKKKWALIILTIYYGIHIITYFSKNFVLRMRSGIDLHLDFGNSFGLNIFPLIVFILLLYLIFSSSQKLTNNQMITTNKI
jgi:hypothetical protein